MTQNILYICSNPAYKTAPEAGSRVFDYYLTKLAASENLSIKVICVTSKGKQGFAKMKQQYAGKVSIELIEINALLAACRKLYFVLKLNYWLSFFSPQFAQLDFIAKYLFIRKIKKIKKGKWQPSKVLLEWTEMMNLNTAVRKQFPNAKIFLSPHDILFQRYERFISSNSFLRSITKTIFRKVKAYELFNIGLIDKTIVLSHKDKVLLCEEGILPNKVMVISPFFSVYKKDDYSPSQKILFWGAMTRMENIEAASWFIRNVFTQMHETYTGLELVIVGNASEATISKFSAYKGVTATGFIDDPSEYFNNCMCLVAPLIKGAGIKIKVLEAMSSGLPVLTNDIGIEGINAERERDFFFCYKPEDYKRVIEQLINEPSLVQGIGMNAKRFIDKNYNYETDSHNYNLLVRS